MVLPKHEKFHLLNRRVSLRQGDDGLRAGTDCVLLAATPVAASRVLELGCAVGQSLLCYAVRHPQACLTGVEIQADEVALARANKVDNGVDRRMAVVCGDFSDRRMMQEQGIDSDSFDLVLMNPPYLAEGRYTVPQHPSRKLTHIERTPLSAWIAHGLRYCRQFGHVSIIHRPERLPEILRCLEPRAGNIRLWPIYARKGRLAQRVIVVAQKSRHAALQMMPGVIMHENDGYSAAAKCLLEQGDALPLTSQY